MCGRGVWGGEGSFEAFEMLTSLLMLDVWSFHPSLLYRAENRMWEKLFWVCMHVIAVSKETTSFVWTCPKWLPNWSHHVEQCLSFCLLLLCLLSTNIVKQKLKMKSYALEKRKKKTRKESNKAIRATQTRSLGLSWSPNQLPAWHQSGCVPHCRQCCFPICATTCAEPMLELFFERDSC